MHGHMVDLERVEIQIEILIYGRYTEQPQEKETS